LSGRRPIDALLDTARIFRPVLTLQRFGFDEERLSLANGTRYGLAASVWTENLSRANRFSG
jgi:acyl-CoA reductase-like NAD-dependent aldehyde dehydrogenase